MVCFLLSVNNILLTFKTNTQASQINIQGAHTITGAAGINKIGNFFAAFKT